MSARVILDTNIIVSALMTPTGQEALVLLLALQGQLDLCISPAVLAEYESVLPRAKFKLDPREIEATLANIRKSGRLVHPTVTLSEARHEPDNRFYECAAAANADYIVTGNTKDFPKPYKTTQIVNARQLLDLLAEEKK